MGAPLVARVNMPNGACGTAEHNSAGWPLHAGSQRGDEVDRAPGACSWRPCYHADSPPAEISVRAARRDRSPKCLPRCAGWTSSRLGDDVGYGVGEPHMIVDEEITPDDGRAHSGSALRPLRLHRRWTWHHQGRAWQSPPIGEPRETPNVEGRRSQAAGEAVSSQPSATHGNPGQIARQDSRGHAK